MRRGILSVLAGCLASVAATPAPSIDLRPGLVLTTNVHSSLVTSSSSYPVLDMEDLISVLEVGAEQVVYGIRMSAPANLTADGELKKFRIRRIVRRADLESAARMTLLYGSDDPETYAGQTFAETSGAVLDALKSKGESPFVLGVNFQDQTLAALFGTAAGATSRPAGTGDAQAPLDLSGVFAALGAVRHYYRGTLRHAEPGTVPLAVLLNGVRTTVPAVHASGTFTFGSEPPVQAEVFWLDDVRHPLTLKWSFGKAFATVTRIDTPVAVSAAGSAAQAGGGGRESMAAQLAGKDCRVELHGIYFNTGSARLLEESEPMLKEVAGVITSHPSWSFTIEGHTDNIGPAKYNEELSKKRAEAVLHALVGRYGVAEGRLSAKGIGLTRPVESNATIEGRTHNRRVELSRVCGPGG